MKRIEGLRDDKTLLSLLRNVSRGGFSRELDCLEYLHVHGCPRPRPPSPSRATPPSATTAVANAATDSDPSHFIVRMSGITSTTASLADLMTRMGKVADPAMQIRLRNPPNVENFLAGQSHPLPTGLQKNPKEKSGT